MTSFGSRLQSAVARFGRLCVGIDPHEHLLAEWDLPASAAGVREFGLRAVDAAAGRVAIVKPQVSFFERWGAAGFAALEDVLAAARRSGLLVIADAKRGDIGSTMDAYASAWLSPGSPLEADAITANPYLGVGALTGAFDLAHRHGKGVFVLAATSNPEARSVQASRSEHGTVAEMVVTEVDQVNESHAAVGTWGSVGLVVGATVDLASAGVHPRPDPPAPILAPGFGVQGARLADIDDLFGAVAPHVLASESRSLLRAGPQGLAAAIDAHRAELERTGNG